MIAEIIKDFDICLISESKLEFDFSKCKICNKWVQDKSEANLVDGYFYM